MSTAAPTHPRHPFSAPHASRPSMTNRIRSAIAVTAVAALTLAFSACSATGTADDPTVPPRQWTSSNRPVAFPQEDADAHRDVAPSTGLSGEHGLVWFHYAPVDGDRMRVFFPAAETGACGYRSVLRETNDVVAVAVVEGSVARSAADGGTADGEPSAGSGDVIGCDASARGDRLSSMLLSLRAPIGDRDVIDLADLPAAADDYATDASAVPEVLIADRPDIDMIVIRGYGYVNVAGRGDAIPSADDLRAVGAIGRVTGADGFFADWDATALPPGTVVSVDVGELPEGWNGDDGDAASDVFGSDDPPLMVYAEVDGSPVPYQRAVEG